MHVPKAGQEKFSLRINDASILGNLHLGARTDGLDAPCSRSRRKSRGSAAPVLPGEPWDEEDVAVPSVNRRDHERPAVDDELEVADQGLVENRVDRRTVVCAAFRVSV